MAVERPLEGVDSGALFRSAMEAPPVAEPPAPAPAPEPPATPPGEPAPAPKPEPPAAAKTDGDEYTGIPPWRLKEETEARRLAEDRARMVEERLNQVLMHLQQQQPQKPKAPATFFEDPYQETSQMIMRAIQPFVEEQRKGQMAMGRSIAAMVHGQETVDKAEDAFLRARNEQTLDVADYERVVQASNRYDAVVDWYKRHNSYSVVGGDPQAWLEKAMEERMADPKFQAAFLERIRGDAAKRPGTVDIPPSLSRITSAQSTSERTVGDLSDASLWAYATGKQR